MKRRLAAGLSATLAALRGFVVWWVGELAALVPGALAARLLGDGAALAVWLNEGRLEIDGPSGWQEVQGEAVRGQIGQADRIVLRLPAATVLRRVVTVPAAAGRQLHAAIPFLVERHTPFLRARATAAWRVVERNPAGRSLRLELAVTDAAALGQHLARLQTMDVPVSAVQVDGDERLPRLDFKAHDRAWQGRLGGREPAFVLLAAAVALALAGPAMVASVVHWRAWQAARQARVQAGLGERAVLDRLRADMAAASVLAPSLGAPSALATLLAVTQALPDDAWLFGFDLAGRTLEVQGFSADLPATVARLQALPGLDRLEFKSPVMHGGRDNKDRFDLILRLKQAEHAEQSLAQPAGGPAAAGDRRMVGVGVH